MQHIVSPAIYLFVIAAVATTLLVMVHAITLEPIANQLRLAQENMMQAVLPQADEFTEVEGVELIGSMNAVFEARSQGQLEGVVVSLAPVGYSGPIEMIVGISIRDNIITGMRVVRHGETPGFGDAAARAPFFDNFTDRPLNPLTVVRSGATGDQIDSIAASTITTAAVVAGVNDAIEWYRGGGL
jgi:electron transport complex protein RnfG